MSATSVKSSRWPPMRAVTTPARWPSGSPLRSSRPHGSSCWTLSAAAAEITRDLAPGSVDLRLRGREPSFVVTPPPAEQPFDEPGPPAADVTPPAMAEGEEGAAARISFRLPEHLKGRIGEAAAQAGLSVNAWLVRAASAALEPGDRGPRRDRRPSWGGQRYTGWVR